MRHMKEGVKAGREKSVVKKEISLSRSHIISEINWQELSFPFLAKAFLRPLSSISDLCSFTTTCITLFIPLSSILKDFSGKDMTTKL